MKYKISYHSENHTRLHNRFIGIGFEHPSKNGIIEIDSKFYFSCWIAHELSIDPTIEIDEDGSVINEYKSNISRPDVIEHFATKNISDIKACGFYIPINTKSNFKIRVKNSDEKIDAWSFNLIYKNTFLKQALEEFHAKPRETGQRRHEQIISNLSHRDFNIIDRKEISSLTNYSDIFNSQALLSEFIEALSDPFWNLSAISSSIKDGRLSISRFKTESLTYCEGSITIDDYNYLIFSENDTPYFVVQHINVACIIFPTLLLAINISVEQWSITAINNLKYLYLFFSQKESSEKNVISSPAIFKGIHISQSRPYHTIYDVLQGIYSLREKIPASEHTKINFLINDKMSFFPDEVYSGILNSNNLDFFHYASKELFFNNGYSLFPSVQYSTLKNKEIIERVSLLLVNQAKSLAPIKKSEFEYVLWVGISTEKRSWLEQKDGWKNILNELSKKSNILVVIDGRTFPMTATDHDRKIKTNEDNIFSYLTLNCPNVTFLNAIGMRALEKIMLATNVDIFITSYATDSIYPSCIAKRQGIVYSPHQISGQKYLHIHHNIIEVDQLKVKSIPNDHSLPWYSVSVSIDWHELLELIESKLFN